MGRFIMRRLIGMVLVLFAISVLTFLIFNVIPNGDPALRMAGKTPTPTQIDAIRKEWSFDRSVFVQYATTMRKVFSGDLVSYYDRLNVGHEIRRGFPRTLALTVGAALIWTLFGISFGLLSAVRAGRLTDGALTAFALLGISTPVFWIGALANYYLGFKWKLFPNGGYVPLAQDPIQWAYHLIVPWSVLAFLFIGFYSQLLRSRMIDTLGQDFVRTARAKGISERRVLIRHVLRNSLIPIVTLWGLDFGAVIGGGAILTESVFDLRGVGQYSADAIAQLDMPPMLAITMLGAFFIVLLNAIVDILYAALDPRIRL